MPHRDSTASPTKVSPLVLFDDICLRLTNPKVFVKSPLAPIFTNFEVQRAPRKTYFFGQVFPKNAQNSFFTCCFKNLPAAQIFVSKKGRYSGSVVLRKSIWST